MSGGKGGSTSSSVTVPQYIEDAARRNLDRADKISKIGVMPYYGADVAALTPMQEAAAQNIADTAGAFGTAGGNMSQQDIRGGMPEPTTFAGGVRGYSSAPMYEQSLEALAAARPGQKEYIDSFFIDPYTGVAGSNAQSMVDYAPVSGDLGGINRGQTGGGGGGGGGGVGGGNGGGVGGGNGGGGGGGGTFLGGDYLGGSEEAETSLINSDLTDDQFFDIFESGDGVPAVSVGSGGTTNSYVTDQDLYSAPGGFYGGSAANETALINSNLSDEDFWNTFEAGSPAGNGTYVAPAALTQDQIDFTASSLDPFGGSGADVIPDNYGGSFIGGGADGVGNFGQVGDFFGGIGDKLGITNYDGQGTGLLSGLNLTGPVTPKSASELQFEADRAPGGVHYESSGSQRNEAAAIKAGQEKDDQMAQVIDIAAVKDLTKNKYKAQEWLKDNGYGSVDKNDAAGILQGKIADIEKSQLKQGLTDGVVMENDRRQVWVGGEMVANVKSASDAKERLAAAVANKAPPPANSPEATGFTQAQIDLAQVLFAQGVPAAEVRAAVLAQ